MIQFVSVGNIDIAVFAVPAVAGPSLSAIALCSGAAAALEAVMADWPDERHELWCDALAGSEGTNISRWAAAVRQQHPELAQAVAVVENHQQPALGSIFDQGEINLMREIITAFDQVAPS